MKPHYLITGAAGFVGRHLVEHALATTDARITLLDSLSYAADTTRLHEILKNHPGRDVRVLFHDLRAPISDELAERIGPVDVLFNLASNSHIEQSIQKPYEFVRNNYDLMLHVLEYCRTAKDRPKMLLQCSTDEVYGVPTGDPHVEWDRQLPSNPYAASKSAQEQLCVAWWRTYGVPVVIANIMNMCGDQQHPEKFVPKALGCLMRGEPVPLHGQQQANGEWKYSSRVWLHATDLAATFLWLADKFLAEGVPSYPDVPMPEKFHVAGEAELANDEVVQILADALGLEEYSIEPVDFHSSRPGHDMRYALDSRKIREAGCNLLRPSREALAQAALDFAKNFKA
jgi:dTDP-glucose 4,6-dehydratase